MQVILTLELPEHVDAESSVEFMADLNAAFQTAADFAAECAHIGVAVSVDFALA